ncbi:type II toxin-antitoxin system Phd/YefM family antitoxin [Falsiroseomonas tokyonensis]|uniref:Type II toxin-antitoxin system Phd/YefM family antitoxin n=1 Tax=Falsiroseomonas tokyonensis TaxID=430521 RepID=A0ABV7BZU2_9PROT|nr:type II toxin-antitoxin system prevent-host-death family antitoxin [Falsiroseomonas tokyonensis]MBU8541163.1 type II toxin-antitoxin system prevent-host-death family antitoxin [Falsiroseomonas tokyonensis]
MDGTIEARPELSDLLDRVRRGETLTITESGRPVATLAPAEAPPQGDTAAAERLVQDFAALRSEMKLHGLRWADIKDEGKRGL